ncbi:hypothetical protein [Herbiconiux ginsengi]|uniref:Uncharacterized protein n=1 Tax=Herbiconiux ginsengi TaxID=381665 RepID=A0A1H3KHW0_9MICO|nr:hypothetical protein [Herbiconiux ginsengi]SDY51365.1 hypothetical protein SAMN05216554_0555 [Herbiconiux ginsengi]
MRRARRATIRPALWSPDGVEPLPGTTYLEHLAPHDGDAPLLAAAAVLEACRNPLGTTSVHTVAERLTALQGPHDVDRMLEAIRLDVRVSRLRLAELGRWLCRFGVRDWQVKGGLALLGISGTPGDAGLVARLGLLDDVTLYAAVALRNLLPPAEAESALFDLAKKVEGSGRIHCVNRLKNSRRPDVADWLLQGGHDSAV